MVEKTVLKMPACGKLKKRLSLSEDRMAPTLESLGISQLSVSERIALVQQIWDSIAVEVDQSPLSTAQLQELDRRATEDDENPNETIPWEEVLAEGFARWKK